MSWDNWPPFSLPAPPHLPRISTVINLWNWIIQLWLAARERYVAAGQGSYWPRHSVVWETGIITAVTNTTITVAGKSWDATGTYNQPWLPTNITSAPYPPGAWDVVILDCWPRNIIHTSVTSILSTETIAVPDLEIFVTQRTVPTLQSLVGKTIKILQSGGVWSWQKIPAWPNDNILDAGILSSSDASHIIDNTKRWKRNQHVGHDVMYVDAGGTLRRGFITSNTDKMLTIVAPGLAAAGGYFILKSEGYFELGRISDPIFTWSRSATEAYFTHLPDDSIGFASKAALTYFDLDYWLDDTPYNNDVTKTLRYLQVFIEDFCHFFVPEADYDGFTHRPSIYAPATLFAAAGINAQQSATGSVTEAGIHVSLAVPWEPIEVHYAILDSDGIVMIAGKGTYADGELIGGFFGDVIPGTDPPQFLYENRKIIISLGWSRTVFKDFIRRYEQTCFIPDVDDFGGAVDPPTEAKPGTWLTNPADTTYISCTDRGFVTALAVDRDLMRDGDLGRWVGHNAHGPGISNFFFRGDSTSALIPYYDRFFVGGHPQLTAAFLDGQRSGIATAGTSASFSDTSKNWFTSWYAGAVTRTESGTATGGSATTLIDATKAGSAFWDGTRGRWLGFTLKVLIAGVWHRRLITAHAGVTLTLNEALPASAAGKDYQIDEGSFERNRYKLRKVTLTFADGTVIKTKIAGGDDITQFVPDVGRTIDPGTAYQIEPDVIGGVFLRSGQEWTIPTGPGFRADQRDNLPGTMRRYGRYMLGDGNLMRVLMELYVTMNFLTATMSNFTWATRRDPDVPEDNNRQNIESHRTDFDDAETDPINGYFTNWGPYSGLEPDHNPAEFVRDPIALYYADNLGGFNITASIIRTFGYGVMTSYDGAACPVSGATDFYVKTATPGIEDYAAAWPDEEVGLCSYDGPPFDPETSPKVRTNFIFDANGDPVLCGRFKRFSAAAGGKQTGTEGVVERRSGKLGSLTRPNRPPDPQPRPPSGPSDFVIYYQGWKVVDKFAITIWNFKYRVLRGDLPILSIPGPGAGPPPDSSWWWWWS